MDPIAESRRDSYLKSVVQKLRFPSDSELQRLARLAGVDDEMKFGEHIRQILLDAHVNDSMLRTPSIPKVKTALESVSQKARALGAALRRLGVGTKGFTERAGMLLEWEMNHPPLVLIPDCIKFLDSLADSASRAARHGKSNRGPRGAGGNPAFNLFIESLLVAAWQRGGDWTIFRSADHTWTGSLLEAVTLLGRYLPDKFLPSGRGRSIEHIRKKLKDHTTK
jgi:hypothetical protein